MLNSRFAPFAAIALSAAVAIGQEPAISAGSKPAAGKGKAGALTAAPAKPVPAPAPARARRTIAKSTPVPVATPIPKKTGFWERLFGKKKPAPTPVPATPKPVKKKTGTKKKPNTAVIPPTDATQDSEKTDTANVEDKKPGVESTPKPVKPRADAKRAENFPPSTDNPDAEVVEKQKYEQAKAKAVADAKVQELRGKADLATSEEESRKALRAYNKAMFKRMKEIDPSIKDHVDRMEAAVMSRLGGE